MDTIERLKILTSQMFFEPAEEASCLQLTQRQQDAVAVSNARLPNGKQIKLMKTLLTSACERNCYYCPFRSGRDFRRTSLSPDEMARAFTTMQRAGIVEGMFLSSGVAGGGIRTQDQLIDTAKILRTRYYFRGYLHLKLMPGAQREQVEQAMYWADRVSINLEAPNTDRLHHLAPRKAFIEELLQPMRWVEDIRRTLPGYLGWKGRWPSITTQFVVGAVGESDLELLATTAQLNRELRLARAYFSAFRPVKDTPLENTPPTPADRQLRLYQASFLLRDYNYDLEDMPFESNGNLPTHVDPKTAWARAHLEQSPVEINKAEQQDLMRIPGIGPKGAKAILLARRKGVMHVPEDLRKIGINPTRALPYILINGKRPEQQMAFW